MNVGGSVLGTVRRLLVGVEAIVVGRGLEIRRGVRVEALSLGGIWNRNRAVGLRLFFVFVRCRRGGLGSAWLSSHLGRVGQIDVVGDAVFLSPGVVQAQLLHRGLQGFSVDVDGSFLVFVERVADERPQEHVEDADRKDDRESAAVPSEDPVVRPLAFGDLGEELLVLLAFRIVVLSGRLADDEAGDLLGRSIPLHGQTQEVGKRAPTSAVHRLLAFVDHVFVAGLASRHQAHHLREGDGVRAVSEAGLRTVRGGQDDDVHPIVRDVVPDPFVQAPINLVVQDVLRVHAVRRAEAQANLRVRHPDRVLQERRDVGLVAIDGIPRFDVREEAEDLGLGEHLLVSSVAMLEHELERFVGVEHRIVVFGVLRGARTVQEGQLQSESMSSDVHGLFLCTHLLDGAIGVFCCRGSARRMRRHVYGLGLIGRKVTELIRGLPNHF